MNNRLIVLLIAMLLLGNSYLFSQTELINVTPLSPNAAALSKYIESPVGSFTGVPPISFPLTGIKTSDIAINISLNYHAGGNRVETIGSWVGMGWSLTGIPSISRQMKDLADEGTGGFFYKPAPTQTVKYIYENREQPGQAQPFYNLLAQAIENTIDTEPDIYSYNLINASGKFFYNQETEKFDKFPKANIRISKSGVGYMSFIITDEQGLVYHFDVLENSSVQGSSMNPNQPNTTTWYPSKIISSSGKDTVFFEYSSENQVFRSNFGSTYLVPLDLDGDILRWTSEVNSNGGYRNNFASTYTTAKLPSRIRFSQGSLYFNKQSAERLDLEGGHVLESLVLKDNQNQVISEHSFSYSYLNGANSGDALYAISNSKERNYLLLDSFSQKGGYLFNTHSFKYNHERTPACRISTAQDDWGYYNGKTLNSTLLPMEFIMHYVLGSIPPPLRSDGSDRQVDTSYNQFGILTDIEYPTGGKTTYTFETHKTKPPLGGYLRKYYKPEFAAIEVADGQTTTWPTTAFYQTNFTISNPQDKYLNNLYMYGGAFVKIDAGYFGCDLTHGSAVCAQIAIRSVSGTPSTINMPIYANKSNNMTDMEVFLPNGNYVIEASFNQDPPQYNNFYIALSWSSLDSAKDNTSGFAGGLRVKKISHYSSKDDLLPALETEYKYTIDFDSTKSSGEMFSGYGSVYSKKIETSKGDYQQLTSAPAMPAVLESGSAVGYTRVYAYTKSKDANEISISETNYQTAPDEANTQPPFQLLQNNELIRGKMGSEVQYTSKNGVRRKVAEKIFEYEYMDTTAIKSYSFIVDHYRIGVPGEYTPWHTGLVIYNVFYHYPAYSYLLKRETSKSFSSTSDAITLQTTKEYAHDPVYFQVKADSTTLSDHSIQKNVYYRPYDLRQSDTYYQQLVDQNQVSRVVKTESFINNLPTQATQVKFNAFNGITLPYEVYRKNKNFSNEKIIEFAKYDSKGNILEQNKENDVKEVYLWGYKGQYPVAKILNTTYLIASSYIDQNILDNPASEIALRTHLANLRNIPGALVSIYTFKPLIGISSETDPNGRTTYYEYDNFNRLHIIRDKDNNILKQICYNYTGQPVQCNTYYNGPIWESTGQTRCQPCPQNSNYITNVREHQEKDNNPNSSTYNTLRWVSDGVNSNCVIVADWQNTTQPLRCKKNGSNQNTGEQEQEQRDMNPCSPTYFTLRWITVGTNTTACPLPAVCSGANCSGVDKRCVNGVCETGTKVYTSSYLVSGTQWACVYHYEWSDNSTSTNYTEYNNSGPCTEEEGF